MRKLKLNPIVLIVFICALAMFVGNTYARYAKTETVTGTLTVSAKLGEIAMDEVTVNGAIIPGVDIPVNHTVKITEKSSIPAYVYLVVETNISDFEVLSFSLSNDHWQKIESVSGNGKNVYVYVNNGTPIEVTSNVDISVKGTLVVSQNYTANGNVTMTFAAAMYQTAAGENAANVYKNSPQS